MIRNSNTSNSEKRTKKKAQIKENSFFSQYRIMAIKVVENSLSTKDIQEIVEIIKQKRGDLLNKLSDGRTNTTISVSDTLKQQIDAAFGFILPKEIPISMHIGDTTEHVDCTMYDNGKTSKESVNTYILNLTTNVGQFKIEDKSYPLKEGTLYMFSGNTTHSTINTGDTMRLSIGACNEKGQYRGIYGGVGVIDGSVIEPLISNICFPINTPITTDQGIVSIDKINTSFHTIHNKPIVHITKTKTTDKYLICFKKNSLGMNSPNQNTVMSKHHKVVYKGQLIEAYKLVNRVTNVTKIPYKGELLYNVLMEKYSPMVVNNLTCETLHPNNLVAKLYTHIEKIKQEDMEDMEDVLANVNKCIEQYNSNISYNKVNNTKLRSMKFM